jgi:hypothetical protein
MTRGFAILPCAIARNAWQGSAELDGKGQSCVEPLRGGPGSVLGQLRAKLVDFGDQPFLNVTASIDYKHGISQEPRQALEAIVPFGRVGSRSR